VIVTCVAVNVTCVSVIVTCVIINVSTSRLSVSEEQSRNEMAAVVAFKEAKIEALQADREQMIQEVSVPFMN